MRWLIQNWFVLLLAYAYGFFTLFMFALLALFDGSFLRKSNENDRKLLKEAQEKFWNLSGRPFGVTHKFFKLQDGRRLHYVEKIPGSETGRKNLTIFIHGFPDSWPVWRRLLASPRLSEDSVLVALDLPGYGGSDDFPKMDADAVLGAITEFVLSMRESHLEENGRVLIVTHDWGSIFGYRLAAEAPQLADRFIISSVFHPQLLLANIRSRFSSAGRMVKTFYRGPQRNSRILKTALNTLAPCGVQLYRSGYIFAFNLPSPFRALIGRMGDAWVLRLMHRLAFTGAGGPHRSYKPVITPAFNAEAMSCSHGPGLEQCQSSSNKAVHQYPESVAHRVPDYGWESKTRIYRHGAAFLPWNKTLETLIALNALDPDNEPASPVDRSLASRRRSSSAGPAAQALFDDAPQGALKAPTTILYGRRDPGFDVRVSLDGIKEYLVKGSQVAILQKAGHWPLLEEKASEIMESIVSEFIKGDEAGTENLRALAGETVKLNVDV